ncbi:NAD(P)H-hydrate dehydratase [Staphylospora marina]|uniref:NAD(P)H-hydrate dehydratase n=1 Tax=Staphylospora marina TaxID=2490858 RepID=UPI000F5BBAC7|nr:NAD(P)H-hydrate dehydratase [Staphylospora marina]
MYLVTAEEMRELDRQTIEHYGIPAVVLMDHAGKAVASEILKRHPRPGRVTILAGTGNNGGDGFAAARHLRLGGWDVSAWLVGEERKLTSGARVFHDSLNKWETVKTFRPDREEELIADLRRADVVLDALVGTGARGPLRPLMAQAVRLLEGHRPRWVFSADIPSGVDTDTGNVSGEAVRADVTVTFQYPKWGHYLRPGADHAGETVVADIGIMPPHPGSSLEPKSRINHPGLWREHLVPRDPWSHKGTHGHLLIIGGAEGMPGSVRMAAGAAWRAGVGYVTLTVPESERMTQQASAVQETVWSWPGQGTFHPDSSEWFSRRKNRFSAVVAGPGLARFPGEDVWLRKLLERVDVPLLLDADALNILSDHPELEPLLRDRLTPVVLTPHPGEMSRLLRTRTAIVESDRPGAARTLAGRTGAVVVLKGRYTLIATPDGRCILNTTGGPALAKAGSGDVLSGLVGALLARGIPPVQAASMGVWLHGRAGELCGPPHSVTFANLLEAIGPLFADLSTKVPD